MTEKRNKNGGAYVTVSPEDLGELLRLEIGRELGSDEQTGFYSREVACRRRDFSFSIAGRAECRRM